MVAFNLPCPTASGSVVDELLLDGEAGAERGV